MNRTQSIYAKLIPSLKWLSTYTAKLFKKDFLAGLNVLVILVPQGMAYALLAGVPPIYGLYAGVIPVLIYAIFGTSMHLSIGPAAISSILIMEGISQIAVPESVDFVNYVLLTGLLVGGMQLLLGILRLGFFIRFLSRPVVIGFTSAAAFIIATSQFKYLFGFNIPRFPTILQSWKYVGQHFDQFHFMTFIICILGMMVIYGCKKIHKSLPGGLIAVVLAIIAMVLFDLDKLGVEIVGELPKGLPRFVVPSFIWEDVLIVLPTSILLTFLSMVESVSIAKFWANKSKVNYFNANQELIAYGLSKLGGAFFQAIPASGSNSRSAVNFTSGAQTQMSSIVSFVFMCLTLLFFSHFFFYLPKAILSAIILLAVIKLVSYREIKNLYKVYRPDFWIAIVTFAFTMLLGVRDGIIIGTLYAICTFLYLRARPSITLLGESQDGTQYLSIDDFPEVTTIPNCNIVKFNASLFYFNALHFTDYMDKVIGESDDQVDCIILDVSPINAMDSSGITTLQTFQQSLADQHIQLYICGESEPFQRKQIREALADDGDMVYQFSSLSEGVQHYKASKKLPILND